MRFNTRRARQLGLVIGIFALLIALQVWNEYSRAEKEFEQVKADLMAKGEKLTLAAVTPKPYPTNENGGPLFFAAAADIVHPPSRFRSAGMIVHRETHEWKKLIPIGEALASTKVKVMPYNGWNNDWVEDMWAEIEPFVESNRDFAESLHQTVTNRFITLGYESTDAIRGFLANLAACKGAITLSKNTVLFDLSRGNRRPAMAHLTDASEAVAKLRDERRIITHLIRVSCGAILLEPLWESLQNDGWSDAELAALQKQWEHMEFIKPAIPALEYERVDALEEWKKLRADPEAFWSGRYGTNLPRADTLFQEAKSKLFQSPGDAFAAFSDSIAIASWKNGTSFSDGKWFIEKSQIELDALRSRTRMKTWLGGLGASSHTAWIGYFHNIPRSYPFSQCYSPSLALFTLKLFAMDTRREIAVTAIALERFRLLHGGFPSDLEKLTPKFLAQNPRDWMAGSSALRYELLTDGRYRLWSVGDDGVDQGGDTAPFPPRKSTPFLGWDRALDWVWPIPMLPADREKVVAKLKEEWEKRTLP